MNTRSELIKAIARVMAKKKHTRADMCKEIGIDKRHIYAFWTGHRGASRRILNGFETYGVLSSVIEEYAADRIIKSKTKLGKTVAQFTLNGEFIKNYSSALEAARQTGVKLSTIRKTAHGRFRHGGGYLWKYTTDTYNLTDIGRCQHCGKTIAGDEKIVIGLDCLQKFKDSNQKMYGYQ